MKSRIVAIATAALVALVGAVLVFVYARGADARAVAAQQPVAAYVTTALVPSGTPLRDALRRGLVAQTSISAKGLPAGALQRVDERNSALLALTDLSPGQYVLATAWGTTPTGQRAIEMPPGMLAVSVNLTDPARVGTFVTPGSRIAIFATYGDAGDAMAQSGDGDTTATSVLFDNVLVIAMGASVLTPTQPGGEEAQGEGKGFLVTVAVTPAQATRLVHAINRYTLYAALRGADTKVPARLTVSDRSLAKEVR